MIPALILALTLAAATGPTPGAPPPAAAPAATDGEPLPPGAPTDDYQLTAWCYGALKEYLDIYERVKPDLIDIDRMFGTQVQEAEPYQSDMTAARQELKMIGDAVTAAEQASPRPISQEGALALRQGAAIWSIVESKTRRELARAWLLWALPDRCDAVSRQLGARSRLLGRALTYNTPSATTAAAPGAPAPTTDAGPTGDAGSALNAPEAAPAAALTPYPEPVTQMAAPPAEPAAPQAPLPDVIATRPSAEPPPAYAAPPPQAAAPAAVMTAPTPAPDAQAPEPAPPAEAPPTAPPPSPLPAADQPSEPLL